VLIVPEVRGTYFVEAQQALLAAGFGIEEPQWVLNPGPDTPPSTSIPNLFANNANVDANSLITIPPGILRPLYVLQQSLPSGTQVPEVPLVRIRLTVIGFPTPFQGRGTEPTP
jgi:hypothetical protein